MGRIRVNCCYSCASDAYSRDRRYDAARAEKRHFVSKQKLVPVALADAARRKLPTIAQAAALIEDAGGRIRIADDGTGLVVEIPETLSASPIIDAEQRRLLHDAGPSREAPFVRVVRGEGPSVSEGAEHPQRTYLRASRRFPRSGAVSDTAERIRAFVARDPSLSSLMASAERLIGTTADLKDLDEFWRVRMTSQQALVEKTQAPHRDPAGIIFDIDGELAVEYFALDSGLLDRFPSAAQSE